MNVRKFGDALGGFFFASLGVIAVAVYWLVTRGRGNDILQEQHDRLVDSAERKARDELAKADRKAKEDLGNVDRNDLAGEFRRLN